MRQNFFLVALLLVTVASTLPIPGNGVLNPPSHFQRYRSSIYPSTEPFYQWWYYWIKDLETNQHFAIAYATARCGTHQTCIYNGTYVLFAQVDRQAHNHFQKYERYPMHDATIDDNFHMRVFNDAQSVQFELNPLNNDTFNLVGHMTPNSPHLWKYENCDTALEVKWNLTLHRIYGYYAQDVFELPDRYVKGIIMWNTYSHAAQVEGTIQIGEKVYQLEKSPRFRAYGDMNWGTQMPSPPPSHQDDRNYAWSWHYASIPSDDLSQELSIIAGTGETFAGFPLYSMIGRFADIRINATHSLQLREAIVWNEKLTSSSDGELVHFDVERSNWTTITDKFGTAQIPMRQVLTMESRDYFIKMDFVTKEDSYNRLLFPFRGEIFSDFEGLGVGVYLQLKYKPTGQMIVDKYLTNGGIEFGFKFKDVK